MSLSKSEWYGFQTPPVFQDISSSVSGFLSGVETYLSVVEQLAQVLSRLPSALDTARSPAVIVLEQAVKVIEAAIADLSKPTLGYTLPIPYLIPALERPAADMDPLSGRETAALYGGQVSREIDAGNQALLHTITRSFHDQNDQNRPQFFTDTHIVGTFMLAGVNNFTDVVELVKFTELSQSLISHSLPEEETILSPIGPLHPRNPRFKFVPDEESENGISLRITWDSFKDRSAKFAFETDIPALQALKPVNFYIVKSEERLPMGDRAALQSAAKKIPYLDTLVGDPQNPSFVDHEIEPETTYFYALGVEYSEIPGSIFFTGELRVYTPENLPASNRSRPPNWIAARGFESNVTGMTSFMADLNAYIKVVKNSLVGDASEEVTKKQLQAILRSTQQYLTLARNISREINSLVARLEVLNKAGVHVMFFTGTGNNHSIIEAINAALQDYRTNNEAPLFGKGSIMACTLAVAGFRTSAEAAAAYRLLGGMDASMMVDQSLALEADRLRDMVSELFTEEEESELEQSSKQAQQAEEDEKPKAC